MKLIIIILVVFLPTVLRAQNFEVKIKLIDPENKARDSSNCTLSIRRNTSQGGKQIYTAGIQNQTATFKDTINASEVAMLGFNIGSRFSSYKLVIDPGARYQITYDMENKKFYVVSNSKSDNLLRFFFNGLESLSQLKDQNLALHKKFIAAKNTQSADSVLKLINNYNKDLRNFRKKIAITNPDNIISAYILSGSKDYDLEEQKIYENFSDHIKKSNYGIALKESMDAALLGGETEIKAKLIDEDLIPIEGKTLTGNAIILNQQYFKENYSKVTLIEFWASWCTPCRESLKKLYSFYYQNKAKDFNVILVSLDDNEGEWKKSSFEDNYPWLNISDGKGHSSDTPKNYKINAISANILIDKNGKIIARNIFDLEAISQILNR